jgi:protein-S-isoprenylcysteine O-methyltransferase Ste14
MRDAEEVRRIRRTQAESPAPQLPRRHWFPKPYADTVARLRVMAGFVMLAAFAWFSHPTAGTLSIGIPLSFCGLALRAWAAGHLAKNQRLAQSGPYAATRNPLYLGTLITAMGLAFAGDSVVLGVFFAALFVVVYLPAIELEEQHLSAILPGYREFAARVPLLLPQWPKSWGPDTFSTRLYLKNQEYQALIGWLAGVAWLFARFILER